MQKGGPFRAALFALCSWTTVKTVGIIEGGYEDRAGGLMRLCR